ncbi:hypothetical protein JOF48_000822 [Arthrobacter stackebrandtii]|uniref:Uncharacterized protein n=1 Tax=Arthrobacter stackebrandtii TaxID=272161 RepID=A0ABS4YTA1_9MICC|nr:hypothetical protein [Arthrobacter stackebrandtii]MBP2412023.1 hypothetical protein [Arthrobacter stackebrandtii]PYG99733.1 hypothetical protein CVV67_13265 [Arthrobacter stackebrandtii]
MARPLTSKIVRTLTLRDARELITALIWTPLALTGTIITIIAYFGLQIQPLILSIIFVSYGVSAILGLISLTVIYRRRIARLSQEIAGKQDEATKLEKKLRTQIAIHQNQKSLIETQFGKIIRNNVGPRHSISWTEKITIGSNGDTVIDRIMRIKAMKGGNSVFYTNLSGNDTSTESDITVEAWRVSLDSVGETAADLIHLFIPSKKQSEIFVLLGREVEEDEEYIIHIRWYWRGYSRLLMSGAREDWIITIGNICDQFSIIIDVHKTDYFTNNRLFLDKPSNRINTQLDWNRTESDEKYSMVARVSGIKAGSVLGARFNPTVDPTVQQLD